MGEAFEKQIKTNEGQGQKQVKALNTLKSNSKLTIEDVIPESALNNDEAKKELDKIKEVEKNIDREKLVYKTKEYIYIYIYSFKNYQTIKNFVRDIYNCNITLKEADEYQTNLLIKIMSFKKNTKPQIPEKNKKKKLFLKTCIIFLRVEKEFLTLLKVKYF